MNKNDPAVQFLLNSTDPSIRYFTLVDLLGKSKQAQEVKAARFPSSFPAAMDWKP